MPTLQLSKGNLNAQFNAAVTQIRDTFHKHGFEIYRDTMVDGSPRSCPTIRARCCRSAC